MTAVSPSGPVDASERLHALDAVRAGALLLGVAFHASMAYLPMRLAPVQDEASRSLLVFALCTHSFRMTLFFLVAGFFARMMIERRGESGFMRNRATRIALPFLVFWPVAALAITLVARWAASVDPHAVAPGWPPLGLRTVPLNHIWFLYYLCLFYAAGVAARAAARLADSQGRFAAALDAVLRGLISWRAAALAASVPLALLLGRAGGPNVLEGVPTPSYGFVPHLIPVAGYGAGFAFGWFLQRQPALLAVLRSQGALHLLAAAGLSSVLFLPMIAGAPLSLPRMLESGLYALTGWCWSLGLLGVALRFLSAERPGVRYVADASYWIYLVHLPLVFALQTMLFPLHWPALVKWTVVLGATLAVTIATYQLLVRYTWLGVWLNGRRRRAGEQSRGRLAAGA